MFKKALLGGTAIAGLAILAVPAQAGTVGSGDNLSVTLSGEYRPTFVVTDQDITDGTGRGYRIYNDEGEVKIDAKNTAENGMTYGVHIEMNALATDTGAVDESNAYVSGDWGRVEMGDQDDATDRMFVEAKSIMVGRAGFDGDFADDNFEFGSDTISAAGNDETSDSTKVTYFTPRFNGFQLGVSLTPDDGANGFSRDTDNDGNFENVWGLGANYEGKFDQVTVTLSLTGEFGTSETSTGADAEGELETISIGGSVEFGQFAFGAGYVDFAEKGISDANINLGEDAGEYWDVAVAYTNGPWGVSLGYFESEKSQPTGSGGDTKVEIIAIDGAYDVAPGWEAALSIGFIDATNINGTATEVDNEGTVVIFANNFKF